MRAGRRATLGGIAAALARALGGAGAVSAVSAGTIGAGVIGAGTAGDARAAPPRFAPVEPGTALAFPRDFGAHPAFRTEWWYLTGWLDRDGGAGPCGFQLTFFRSRTTHDDANPSRFAPRQLLLAHAALSLPERGRLVHVERAARALPGLAWAREGDTDVAIGDWSLVRGASAYAAQVADDLLSMRLSLSPRGAPLLQGEAGFSRKGPSPEQASYYYSEPQIAVSGEIEAADGARRPRWRVTGRAWLDHEWSSTLLDASAAGWDWLGLNLHDGGSLTAFRIRGREGDTRWSHASWADAKDRPVARGPSRWRPLRQWKSPRSGASYPVAMELAVGGAVLMLEPLMDDQEIDGRASTGNLYWEGAVRALHRGREVGRGYLELTGYAASLRL